MSLKVLQQKSQIENARYKLMKMRASAVSSALQKFLRRAHLSRAPLVGDILKSWDVLLTLNFIEKNVPKDGSILDMGCYASEIIVALHKMGFSRLTGIDMNPDVKKMPYQNSIQYEIGDFMRTKFADASFSAITSISVIEHGFDSHLLLREISRILSPGGYFIASFDYWPEKIDTTDKKLFGMDWRIFSRNEVVDFIKQAEDYGLFPDGEMMFESKDKTVSFDGHQYTFAWMVLRKRR